MTSDDSVSSTKHFGSWLLTQNARVSGTPGLQSSAQNIRFFSEFSMIGLALIALGTGGIKPCVAAFGADQFKLPEQERQLQVPFRLKIIDYAYFNL